MARQLIGTVTSDKGDKTIVVTVRTRKTHPLYRKQYTDSEKFVAHDPKNEAEVGDKVAITETRPISRRKHHKLERIIEKPALRADSLAATKADEPERPATKGKAKDEDAAEAKTKTKTKTKTKEAEAKKTGEAKE